jgi:hypothetical protein
VLKKAQEISSTSLVYGTCFHQKIKKRTLPYLKKMRKGGRRELSSPFLFLNQQEYTTHNVMQEESFSRVHVVLIKNLSSFLHCFVCLLLG